jgi:hypothetical protein
MRLAHPSPGWRAARTPRQVQQPFGCTPRRKERRPLEAMSRLGSSALLRGAPRMTTEDLGPPPTPSETALDRTASPRSRTRIGAGGARPIRDTTSKTPGAPAPSEPPAPSPPPRIDFVVPLLHPVKDWSLRESRDDSGLLDPGLRERAALAGLGPRFLEAMLLSLRGVKPSGETGTRGRRILWRRCCQV